MSTVARGLRYAMLLGLIVGCRTEGGAMQVSWIHGPDTMSLRLPATAVSCPELGWLEVVAIRGDTGFGLVVFPPNGELTGRYVVEQPAWHEDSATSVASLAARLYSPDGVLGFTASDGVVQVEVADQVLSGRFVGRLQDLTGTDSAEVLGDLFQVAVGVGGIECETPPDTTDAGVAHSSVD